jgi:hypothetical protein
MYSRSVNFVPCIFSPVCQCILTVSLYLGTLQCVLACLHLDQLKRSQMGCEGHNAEDNIHRNNLCK